MELVFCELLFGFVENRLGFEVMIWSLILGSVKRR